MFKHEIIIKSTVLKCFIYDITLLYKDKGSVFIDYNTGNIYSYIFKNASTKDEVEVSFIIRKSDYENYWVLLNDNEVWDIKFSNTYRIAFYKAEISKIDEYPSMSSYGVVYHIKARGYVGEYRINVL